MNGTPVVLVGLITRMNARVMKPYSGQTLFEVPEFRITAGEIVGLTGESGCGKSVFSREIAASDARFCYVPQDYAQTFSPHISVERQILSVLERYNPELPAADLKARVEGLTGQCGLAADTCRRSSRRISGGQLQRAAIARALASSATLVIADEISAAQDAIHKAELIELMQRLRRDRGLSFLVVSHDRRMLDRLCDRQYVIRAGQLTAGREEIR